MFSTAACRAEDQINTASSESKFAASLTRTEESKPKIPNLKATVWWVFSSNTGNTNY